MQRKQGCHGGSLSLNNYKKLLVNTIYITDDNGKIKRRTEKSILIFEKAIKAGLYEFLRNEIRMQQSTLLYKRRCQNGVAAMHVKVRMAQMLSLPMPCGCTERDEQLTFFT